MNRIVITLLGVVYAHFLLGQFVYESTDFIQVGDEIIYSTALPVTTALDFSLTGEDMAWDFSEIAAVNIDTTNYFDPNDGPYRLSYCFTNGFLFNCQSEFDKLTNLAQLSIDTFAVGDFKTQNITRHYQISADRFSETMLGVTAELEGVEVPVAIDFEAEDVIVHFPLAFGNVDGSESRFNLDLAPVGFNASLRRFRKRINTVDGYGSLKTPVATYDEVLKVKTDIYNIDTTQIDTITLAIPTIEVVYKWYAKGVKGHVLEATGLVVNGEEIITTIRFQGEAQMTGSSSNLDQDESISLYPNPFDGQLSIDGGRHKISQVILYDLMGREVFVQRSVSGISVISPRLEYGVYFMQLFEDDRLLTTKRVVRK